MVVAGGVVTPDIGAGSIGVGALFALYFIVKEIIPRLTKIRNGGGGMHLEPSLREAHREWMENWMDRSLVPRYQQQNDILSEIKQHMQRTNEALAVLLSRKD